MNDAPTTRRTIVGTFSTGGTEIVAFSNIEATMIADAARRLDAEKAEAERIKRATVSVDRQWLLEVLQDLILSMELHRKAAEGRGDHARGRALWRKAWERRKSYDTLAEDDPP